jgi:hypothetical protein
LSQLAPRQEHQAEQREGRDEYPRNFSDASGSSRRRRRRSTGYNGQQNGDLANNGNGGSGIEEGLHV